MTVAAVSYVPAAAYANPTSRHAYRQRLHESVRQRARILNRRVGQIVDREDRPWTWAVTDDGPVRVECDPGEAHGWLLVADAAELPATATCGHVAEVGRSRWICHAPQGHPTDPAKGYAGSGHDMRSARALEPTY